MRLFDRSLLIFSLIGVGNTFLSFLIMQGMYLIGWGEYWLPSAAAFAVTSVISFFLNKKYTFHNHDSLKIAALRFSLVIAICYIVAYLLARPAAAWLLNRLFFSGALPVDNDQIAMLLGQVLFTGLNYLGQRFFAFKERD